MEHNGIDWSRVSNDWGTPIIRDSNIWPVSTETGQVMIAFPNLSIQDLKNNIEQYFKYTSSSKIC